MRLLKVITEKELKQFMTKFNGVSTKYLQNYMYWFMLTKKKVAANDKIKQWIWFTTTYASALDAYLTIKSGAS